MGTVDYEFPPSINIVCRSMNIRQTIQRAKDISQRFSTLLTRLMRVSIHLIMMRMFLPCPLIVMYMSRFRMGTLFPPQVVHEEPYRLADLDSEVRQVDCVPYSGEIGLAPKPSHSLIRFEAGTTVKCQLPTQYVMGRMRQE
jgi:hypothetical protein